MKYSAYRLVQIHTVQATSNTLQTNWFKYITHKLVKILYTQASLQYPNKFYLTLIKFQLKMKGNCNEAAQSKCYLVFNQILTENERKLV